MKRCDKGSTFAAVQNETCAYCFKFDSEITVLFRKIISTNNF
jgi:hypothetical protein